MTIIIFLTVKCQLASAWMFVKGSMNKSENDIAFCNYSNVRTIDHWLGVFQTLPFLWVALELVVRDVELTSVGYVWLSFGHALPSTNAVKGQPNGHIACRRRDDTHGFSYWKPYIMLLPHHRIPTSMWVDVWRYVSWSYTSASPVLPIPFPSVLRSAHIFASHARITSSSSFCGLSLRFHLLSLPPPPPLFFHFLYCQAL